jgi:hypothetical protein
MFSGQLSLYVHPRGQCVMHFSGFSVLAGLIPVVWALHRRLYKLAVFALFYPFVLDQILSGLGLEYEAVYVLAFFIQFGVLGYYGNRIHRILLERGGWVRTEEEHEFNGEATK